MKFKLVPEQEEDAQIMCDNPYVPNFSKAGTGKTHTTLQAMKLADQPMNLILCPVIARGWWANQVEEWLGWDCNVLKTGKSPLGGRVMIATYSIARSQHVKLYDYLKDHVMAMDESHNLRNPAAKQTEAVFGRGANIRGGLLEHSATGWNLTGTPIFSYANDMWTQAGALHKDVWAKHGIHNYEQFTSTFTWSQKRQFHPNMAPVSKISGNRGEPFLKKVIYDEVGAIRRRTIEGLKDVAFRNLDCPIKLDSTLKSALSKMTLAQIMAELTDPDSIVAKAWHTIGMLKVPVISDYLKESVAGGPVLLGCWHRDVMQAYDDLLTSENIKCVQVHGGTPEKSLEAIQNAFNAGETPVLIGQMQKMGSSWNLQERSRHVVIAETHPSPAVVEQFYKRVYRRGQKQSCIVDMFLANIELDHGLNNLRLRKEASAKKVTD